ncbi:hypothetical protein BH10PSE17_BH10PSE17_03190 [soil metagenome]
MLRTGFLLLLIVVPALAFGVWVTVAETGPIGWFNAIQQSMTGSYSVKVSVFLLLGTVSGAIWLGISLYEKVVRPVLGERVAANFESALASKAQAVARVDSRPVTPAQMAVGWLMLVPILWACCYGWYWWKQREHQQDLSAQYVSVDLGSNDGSAAEGHDHLAVRGRYLFDQTLTFRQGSQKRPEYSLVPIVGRNWQPGQAVTFIARVEDVQAFTYERKQDKDPYTFLAARTGDVPSVAVGEFEKLGAPVGPSTLMLRVVPSHEGRPTLDGSAESDFRTFYIVGTICTAVIAVLVLTLSLIKVRLAWSERRARSRAA